MLTAGLERYSTGLWSETRNQFGEGRAASSHRLSYVPCYVRYGMSLPKVYLVLTTVVGQMGRCSPGRRWLVDVNYGQVVSEI